MKQLTLGLGLALALGVTATTASADGVTITLNNGLVTIVADNATPRQIIAEWARVGQVTVVNGDKVPGGPITLRLEDVPERVALDTVLRASAGFMVADRRAEMADASRYDRLMVLPTSTAPPPAPVSAAASRRMPVAPQPVMTQPTEDVVVGNDFMVTDDVATFDEAPEPSAPVVSPYRDMGIRRDDQQPETTFDYANPQRMFEQRRQQMLEQQQGVVGADPVFEPSPGVSVPGGTSAFPGAPIGASRPGEIVTSPQPQTSPGAGPTPPPGFNPYNLGPYGLPVGSAPGTGTTPQTEPDRSKYLNPYAPQPRPDPKND